MGSSELTIDEHMIIISELDMEIKCDTDILWYTSVDKTLGEKLSVTIIATRFQTDTATAHRRLIEKSGLLYIWWFIKNAPSYLLDQSK
jgi:cell division protein FtsZ